MERQNKEREHHVQSDDPVLVLANQRTEETDDVGNGVELVNRNVVVVQTDPKHERQKMDQEEGVEDDVGKGAENTLVDHANAREISGNERGCSERPTV